MFTSHIMLYTGKTGIFFYGKTRGCFPVCCLSGSAAIVLISPQTFVKRHVIKRHNSYPLFFDVRSFLEKRFEPCWLPAKFGSRKIHQQFGMYFAIHQLSIHIRQYLLSFVPCSPTEALHSAYGKCKPE